MNKDVCPLFSKSPPVTSTTIEHLCNDKNRFRHTKVLARVRRGKLRASGGTLAILTSPLNVARGKHPLVCSRTAEEDTDSTPSCNNARE